MIPVTRKCRACEFVSWQASGATAEHCYVFLPMMKMKATGQTVTQLKLHSCHLQTIQLYAKCCVFFTLSPGALVLEYSRIPPWSPPITLMMPYDTWEGCEARPPWEGLHKPMLANHRMSFLNSALSPKEQILLDNQSHPRKQLES